MTLVLLEIYNTSKKITNLVEEQLSIYCPQHIIGCSLTKISVKKVTQQIIYIKQKKQVSYCVIQVIDQILNYIVIEVTLSPSHLLLEIINEQFLNVELLSLQAFRLSTFKYLSQETKDLLSIIYPKTKNIRLIVLQLISKNINYIIVLFLFELQFLSHSFSI
ncbi:unnamed protein product (macronuclear) [Paramecium tetraurelia]|uniref:Transmembrane protein n=1 Tax=Paramecium tetraurelia TaxID=5888 RepID=A0DAJ3_PARTE|nr:uncharacterized protein GSPATT00014967001 [Paramecium tetraurelia]CAK80060.1 unnamed protein product [Paramecium tetraurelia]|eukprot:XP_001447457.1 hypothetical protein (macronuclear) [Paramecium tetraurelia strain d4-2]